MQDARPINAINTSAVQRLRVLIDAQVSHGQGRALRRQADARVRVGQLEKAPQMVIFLMEDFDLAFQAHDERLSRVLKE